MARSHSSYAFLRLALLAILVNSFAYLTVTAHAGSSDLKVDSIWLEDASQPGQPISEASSGQSFLIVATIRNIGQETASGYYVDVYYDSDYGRGGPDNILAGEVQTWYVGPLTGQDGTHTTRWVVDPDNLIAELDEGNNLKEYTFTIGQQTTTTTTIQTTQLLTSTGTTSVIGYTTATLTSYVGTQTSTSTIVVPTIVTVGPSVSTFTLQTAQLLTSTGTTTVTAYTTVTLNSYVGTQTATSTIVVFATATGGGDASTQTAQSTQVLTSTATTTVTGYSTATISSYMSTTTSTSTALVYTTVTNSGTGASAPSSMAYLGFISLLGITVGHGIRTRKPRSIPRTLNHLWKGDVRGIEEDQKSCSQTACFPSVGLARQGADLPHSIGTSRWLDFLFLCLLGRG